MCAESANTKSILVVEDCKDQRDLLQHLFLKKSYRVTVAENGHEAFEKLRQQLPDLIVSNVSMPVMGGFEFCRALKNDPSYRSIPVILVTAFWDVESLLSGMSAGSDYYFLKPLDAKTLMVCVENILSEQTEASAEEPESGELIYEFQGRKHAIPQSRRQILDLLISNHKAVIRQKSKVYNKQLRGGKPAS